MKLVGLLLVLATSSVVIQAQERLTFPKPGDPVRKTLFNVMRPAFENDLHQHVIFQVNTLRLYHGWAFVQGRPLQPNQKPINYRRTRYQTDIKEGAFDDGYCALLHKVNGNWRLVTYNIGATDVQYADWWRRFHAPKTVMPYNE